MWSDQAVFQNSMNLCIKRKQAKRGFANTTFCTQYHLLAKLKVLCTLRSKKIDLCLKTLIHYVNKEKVSEKFKCREEYLSLLNIS